MWTPSPHSDPLSLRFHQIRLRAGSCWSTEHARHSFLGTYSPDSFPPNRFPLQPRSQAPSSLPPLVVRRKTLVAAGHVTTQKLGGKKICWAGGVTECFDCCCCNLCGFQNLEQSLKTTRCIGVWCGILPVKNVALFLPSPEYRRLAFTKKFGSRMELKLFDG